MKISREAALEHGLSKEQQEILIRAQKKGGTCLSTSAYAALLDLAFAEKKSNEEILASVGSTLLSLVELGLIERKQSGRFCRHIRTSVSLVLLSPGDSCLKIFEGLIDKGDCFLLSATPIIAGFCEVGPGGLQGGYATVQHARLVDVDVA
jgi:hypothetical protein